MNELGSRVMKEKFDLKLKLTTFCNFLMNIFGISARNLVFQKAQEITAGIT